MSTNKGTTTSIHADDSAKGTSYDYSNSVGYNLYLTENPPSSEFTIADALDLITYSSLAGDSYATSDVYGYVRLASPDDMDLITVNGDADSIDDVVTVRELQYWVNEVAPATTLARGFVQLASDDKLNRTETGDDAITVGSLNTFLNNSANAATTNVHGAVKLATISDCNVGSNSTKAVTPQGLRQIVDSAIGQSNSIVASETVLGNIKLATSNESLDGNNNIDAITPYTNKIAFDSWINDWWDINNNAHLVAEMMASMIGQESNYPPTIDGVPSAAWVKKNGAVLSRNTYSNLWEWVQSNPSVLVSESEWQAKKTLSPTGAVSVYSSGDGSTTFRIPTIGTQGGYAKSLSYGETVSDPTIGFKSNNKVHSHQTDAQGAHSHENPAHTHSASFKGNELPPHDHEVPRDGYGRQNNYALNSSSN